MTQQPTTPAPDFFTELGQEVRQLWQDAGYGWRRLTAGLRNAVRRSRHAYVDYVVIPIGGTLPERDAPPRSFIERRLPFPEPPLSLQTLNEQLRLIAAADNAGGVLFIFTGLQANWGTLQNLHQSMLRLRAAGKKTAVFTPYLDLPHYYVATAADTIIIPPGTQFEALGLHTELLFLKDALAQIGLQADVVQISPYKTAFDNLSNADITPEQQAQLDWLFDDRYDILTNAIADGRVLSLDEVQHLIDNAPYNAAAAREHGLVDHVAYEDELVALLTPATKSSNQPTNQPTSQPTNPPSSLLPWPDAYPLLLEKPRRRHKKFIGVISLEGMIIMGESRQPPVDIPIPILGGAMAGEETIVALLRQAEKMEQMAALIFHVDSSGGSALASDLIWRQIEQLRQKKPVLVYMGNIAASGGYYVSATADHIMCQPLTITGSIGVITMRLSSSGLYDKLQINRAELQRGERAGLYGRSAPLTETERDIFWESIVATYERFKEIVAEGRDLPLQNLDEICHGRVWTGRQAQKHQLVDSFGDFVAAIAQTAELAGLSVDEEWALPVANLYPSRAEGYTPPATFTPSDAIGRHLLHLISGAELKGMQGRPLYLTPFVLQAK